MKNIKSIFNKALALLLLVIISALLFSSCGKDNNSDKGEGDTSKNDGSVTSQETQTDTETDQPDPDDEGDEISLEYRLKDDDTYELVGIGSITESDIVIPQTYKQKAVTSIAKRAFYDCANITSISIPEGITSIGELSFNGCVHLTSITIPSSVTSIGPSAFNGCYKLVEIYNLSELNIAIGSYDNGYIARYALNVYTPTSGEKKTFITDDGYVFYNDPKACYLVGYNGSDKDLVLPQDCNSKPYAILDFAFYGDTNITSVIIPDGVTSIYDVAFYNCTSLKNVTIGTGLKYIGPYAFDGCKALASVTFENANDWYVSENEDASEKKSIDVSKADNASKYLSDTYKSYYWFCK